MLTESQVQVLMNGTGMNSGKCCHGCQDRVHLTHVVGDEAMNALVRKLGTTGG